MSRWDHFDWHRPAPKKAPPAHGIRMKKAGTTWWGQRWVEALQDVLRGDSARLARGRTYARSGRTHDLVVKGGKVTAKVTGSRSTPYKITIELAQLGEAAWRKAVSGMAAKAQFSAELLSGQMPREIDEVFRASGASLFPKQRADLVTRCSCPDWGDPCKHVAATHYVLGEALDGDPFLLFELRGRTREQVLEALRAARGGHAAPGPAGRAGKAGAARTRGPRVIESPTVTPGKLKPSDYDRPREDLPSLHFSFDAPPTHGAVLRQLGAPAGWDSEGTPADVLGPLVRAAAETARRMAMAEPLGQSGTDSRTEDAKPASAKARRKAPLARSSTR
ncbi:MAG: SWIM zinc finger family protein [Polyangiaceae bacterium]